MNTHNIWDAIETIREAWHGNRAIVPLVGAGISTDSGIPIVRSIVRYFGKLHQFIDLGAYLAPPPTRLTPDPLEKLRLQWKSQPWEYVRHFGWPDRFQLNQDLLDLLASEGKNRTVADAAQSGVEEALQHSNPAGNWHLDALKNDIIACTLTLIKPDLDQKDAIKYSHDYLKAWNGSASEKANARQRLEDRLNCSANQSETLNQIISRFKSRSGNSVAWDVAGDWKRLIQYFTNYQGDYADALITRLCAGRGPSLGHQFLAYFCKLVGSRLICTYNFDDLIERSFQSQGTFPRVFAMEEGIKLPPETLVRDNISVLKLHGNNHALLLDERVDHPLSGPYKERFNELVGHSPLLLVVGCSGNDMRVRDLIQHVLQEDKSPNESRVVWLHFEDEAPRFLDKWTTAKHPRVIVARTSSPGADLLHIYTALSGRHPAGASPYPIYLARPIPVPATKTTPQVPASLANDWNSLTSPGCRGAILSTLAQSKTNEDPKITSLSASETLVEVADWWLRQGYQIIWVDLESLNTIAGVAGSILDQCRAFDIHLAPSVLKEIDELAIDPAVRRVARALERSRYFVVLDGLETYLWGPLTHHGHTHYKPPQSLTVLRHLMQFFYKLSTAKIGESRVWLGVDPPKLRNARSSLRHLTDELLQNLIYGMEEDSGAKDVRAVANAYDNAAKTVLRPQLLPLYPPSSAEWKPIEGATRWPFFDHYAMRSVIANQPDLFARYKVPDEASAFSCFVLLHLTCFRRTRPLATLRHVLGVLFLRGRATSQLDELLRLMAMIPQLGVIRMSGGGVWFNRSTRDYIYGENSQFTSTHSMSDYLLGKSAKKNPRALVMQLFLLTTTHQRISRTYHNRGFVQSRDCFAFLEYTYHRISSIRYLAKLIAVVIKSIQTNSFAEVREALIQCGDFLRSALAPEQSSERFSDFLARLELDGEEDGLFRRLLSGETNVDLSANNLLDRLRDRHTREIRCLYRGWVRTEQDLREQVPAQQLLLWAKQLLDEEFVCRLNQVVTNYGGIEKGIVDAHCWNTESGEVRVGDKNALINPDAEHWISVFKSFVTDLIVKLHMDRTDYDEAISMLAPVVPARPVTMRQIHRTLDLAVCHLRSARQLDDGGQDSEHRDKCEKCLEQVEAALKENKLSIEWFEANAGMSLVEFKDNTDKPSEWTAMDEWRLDEIVTASASHQEAILRLGHIRAEQELCDVSIFAAGFYTDDVRDPRHTDRPPIARAFGHGRMNAAHAKAAKTAIDEGLREYRLQTSYGGRAPHGALVERAVDGTVYPVYRSIFYTLLGRLDWQRRWLMQTDQFLQPDNQDIAEGTFEAAYRAFEMARAGLSPGNRLLVALNELYYVEATLAHARVRLFQASRIAKAQPSSGVSNEAATAQNDLLDSYSREAATKHEAARYALQRARNELLTARRNVAWWRFYYQLTAQYHAERLLAGLESIIAASPGLRADASPTYFSRLSGEKWSRILPAHLTRLRRGYSAIRSAFDYGFDHLGTGSRWLSRAWAEMTLAAFAIGCEALRQYYAAREEAYVPEIAKVYILQHLQRFNEQERLYNFAAGGKLPLALDEIFLSETHPFQKALDAIAKFPKPDSKRRFDNVEEIRNWAAVVTNFK